MLPATMATGSHHHLRNNHRGGGKQSGIEVSRRGGDRHAQHRQQCGIGEMEQHQGYAGDQQRRMAEQDGKPRQGGRGCRFDAAGGIIVDIAAADRQQGDQGKQRGTGHQNENAADAPSTRR